MSLRVVTDTHAAELATQDDQFASSSISTCLATLSITTGLASRSAQAPRHTILFMYGLRSGRVRSLQGSYREGWDHANFESEDCHCPKNDAQLMPYYQTARLVWKIHDSLHAGGTRFRRPHHGAFSFRADNLFNDLFFAPDNLPRGQRLDFSHEDQDQ
jgi:hypothetical protein